MYTPWWNFSNYEHELQFVVSCIFW